MVLHISKIIIFGFPGAAPESAEKPEETEAKEGKEGKEGKESKEGMAQAGVMGYAKP